MYKLYYNDEMIFSGIRTKEEAEENIRLYFQKEFPNESIPYLRYWFMKNEIWYDVGHSSNYFKLIEE